MKTKKQNQSPTKKTISLVLLKATLGIAVSLIFVVSFFIIFNSFMDSGKFPFPSSSPFSSEKIEFKKFTSAEEFKSYLLESEKSLGGMMGAFGVGADVSSELRESVSLEASPQGLGGAPGRVSETNVQVVGIDEADIVKTDGENIFVSGGQNFFIQEQVLLPTQERTAGVIPPNYQPPETEIVKAFPPADLAKLGSLEKSGEMLLSNGILVIFSNNEVFGFDVSDSQNPVEVWNFEFENRNNIVTSRLYQGKIYLVARSFTGSNSPCPIPLITGERSLSIACVDVYHPSIPVPVDSTYTVLKLNPLSGAVEERVSFLGSSSQSIVYMSPGAIYATYTHYGDMVAFLYGFFNEEGQDLVSKEVIQELKSLKDLKLSDQAKLTELVVILERYTSSLTNDERLKFENEVENGLSDYTKKHIREMERTEIVKIDIGNFEIASTGSVPGKPLNQFSLDEYQSNLRVASTIGANLGFSSESVSDVHILDKNMDTLSSVQNLGVGERIYSVRFIEDKGYVVTFKQIDPFYVLDLSNPNKPELKGELKIPGYSSYLHPISKDMILGVGKEGSNVKVSLFDVSNPQNPREQDKYQLDDYYSDILNTHHAFLLDKDHQIFFLPGTKGGYIFSYKGNQLELLKAVSDVSARRALYLDDYLYIVGNQKLVVLDENSWERINSLDF